MKRRPTRPFVVEVKRSRTSRPAMAGLQAEQGEAPADELPPVAVLPRDTVEGLNDGSEHDGARRAAGTLFGRKPVPSRANGRHEPEIAATPSRDVPAATPASRPNPAKQPVTGRILPDLLTVDPLELRLRQEAEERAARRRGPRGPRKAPGMASRPESRPDRDAARQAAVERAVASWSTPGVS